MSIYLHFRAVSESGIRDDHTWLAAFMSEAWENDEAEYAAGIAHSINKSWNAVNDLYAAADALCTDADEPWTLPIYGGRPVPHGTDADPSDPPLMLLEPSGVSRAARFLTAVPFDDLWNVVDVRFTALGRTRQEHLEHHRGLQEFYGQAASAGHAVVKAVWA
ncbi:DUF1877 family protein [Streptomyces sp. Tu 3180]|uniref:DUF1877 family protein n=1 Tax=Streptomyces sp. Tu 3180 TaxID=2682611 RepID=UPI001358E162|nr:DUF1877 family protein [Streptomyces sp. Tu 3180]KAF3463178.1 DUF1877 family protein [Streptomyces sp. Tu 3180]